MKKLTMGLALIIATASGVYAQQWVTSGSNIYNSNTGNVGIGISAPVEKLHIQDGNLQITSTNSSTNTVMGSVKIAYATVPNAYAGISGMTNGGGLDQVDLLFYTAYGSASEKMRIMASSGYVGIGTPAPVAKLDVRGVVSVGTTKRLTLNPDFSGAGELSSGAYIGSNGINTLAFAPSTDVGSVGAKAVFAYYNTNTWLSAIEYANVSSGYSNLLLMKSGGNVGIGTISPKAKLDVNGNIFSSGAIAIGTADVNKIRDNLLAVNGNAIFNKATVRLYANWPDYVFSPTYKMPSLDSLEQFIQLNKHLPEIPTASDVEKNGIDLGDNQILLLKKIEELTLIVIEQNKSIQDLKRVIQKIASNEQNLNK